MKIYTAAQMRAAEQAAVDKGTSFEQLMENAGQAAAADLLLRRPEASKALIVCGKGNNGGDGLVVARVLAQQGWTVDVVFVVGNTLSELAELNRKRLLVLPNVRFFNEENLSSLQYQKYALFIDAIFGTGFSGDLPDNTAKVCRVLNDAAKESQQDGCIKVALDIPTGLNGDTGEAAVDTFRANLTYAFAALKPAHVQPQATFYCGEIVCLDIGIE